MGEVSARTDVIIAVDGGGSKTDAVALAPDGTVLARARSGGSSPQLIGLERSIAVLDELVVRVLLDAGAERPARVHAYLSGLDLPAEIDAYAAAVAAQAWSCEVPVIVDNDLFALLRAGTLERDAVAVVCGTGINALGVRADGATVRFPALGMISGDWGGGWFLGERALWHAARADDGRGPATMLTDRIPAEFGLATLAEVIESLHFARMPFGELSRLSPTVFTAAADGDAVSQRVVDRQAEEVAVLAVTALRRLELLETRVPVVLGGGVIAGADRRLMQGIAERLATDAPNAVIEHVTAAPIVGAALLALDAAGADAVGLRRAAAAFTSVAWQAAAS